MSFVIQNQHVGLRAVVVEIVSIKASICQRVGLSFR
jgi:hypothetical protein